MAEKAVINFLGASLWVSVVSLVGYFFGSRWDRLIDWMKRFNIAIAITFVALFVFALAWWRRRKRTDASEED